MISITVPDTDVPFFEKTGRKQCPAQKLWRVVKPETIDPAANHAYSSAMQLTLNNSIWHQKCTCQNAPN